MSIIKQTEGGASSNTFSFDIGTAGTDRLIVVMYSDNSSLALSNVTVDGKSAIQIHGLSNNTLTSEMWYIMESGLGSSNGTVTITCVGGDAGSGVHAYQFTGVDQTTVNDSNTKMVSGDTIDVKNVSTNDNGLIISTWAADEPTVTVSSITAPLTEKEGPHPDSAYLVSAWGIESPAQVNKDYMLVWSVSANNNAACVASFDQGPEVGLGQTHQMII